MYVFADKANLGLTNCAPLRKQRNEKSDAFDFFGALCVDLDPSGQFNEYLDPRNDEYASYLVFNNDEAFDSITDVNDSQFKTFV